MSYRKVNVGSVELAVFFPQDLARKIRTLGGILPDRQLKHPDAPMPLPKGTHSSEAEALQQRLDKIEWYHTIDLGNGLVTPGWFDLRPHLDQYPLPPRMDGMRVLDVATFDGFWAFEFAKRGAAEVVALDIDSFAEVDMAPRLRRQKDPAYFTRKTGEGFRLCQEVLGTNVRREVLNVYDLSPERLGTFDMVFVSDLLLHLMNPMKALNNICSVTRGYAVIADVYNAQLPTQERLMSYQGGVTHNIWWSISYGALEQMVHDAGFSRVELKNKFMTGYRGMEPILSHAAFQAWA